MTPSLTVRGTPRKRRYAANRAKPGTPIVERIKMHIAVNANGCWVWQLALVPVTGYGALTVDNVSLRAHRASYEAFVGPIPAGLDIDHLCRNRACVNPQHLEPVTPKVNTNRSPFCRSRITHCPQGHRYSEANTYLTRSGQRQCRRCRDARNYLWRTSTPAERQARKDAGLPVLDVTSYFAAQERVA